MEIKLLRKLTEKSRLNFGKYSELTVSEVLDLRHPNYLRWCYFNLEGISFVENLLDNLIPQEYRIDKPGKNPELGKALENKLWKDMTELARTSTNKNLSKDRKGKYSNYIIKDDRSFSNSVLMRFNHGHRK